MAHLRANPVDLAVLHRQNQRCAGERAAVELGGSMLRKIEPELGSNCLALRGCRLSRHGMGSGAGRTQTDGPEVGHTEVSDESQTGGGFSQRRPADVPGANEEDRGRCQRLAIAPDDPAPGRIVRRHLEIDSISGEDTDVAAPPHFARRAGQHFVTAVYLHPEHGGGEGLAHHPLYSNDVLLFCHQLLRFHALGIGSSLWTMHIRPGLPVNIAPPGP